MDTFLRRLSERPQSFTRSCLVKIFETLIFFRTILSWYLWGGIRLTIKEFLWWIICLVHMIFIMGRSRKIQNERVGRLAGQKRTPRAYTLCPKIRKTPEYRFYQEFFQVLTHLETKKGALRLSKSSDFLCLIKNDQLLGEVKNRWKPKCLYMTGYGTMVIRNAWNKTIIM